VHGAFDGLGRFAEPWLLILTSLSDGPKHGYAIMADVAAFSGVRMEPGTLYGALSRLERRGWVRPLAAAGHRRRYEIAAVWPDSTGRARPSPADRRQPPQLTSSRTIHYYLVSSAE
jgi:DNA-binding PadR family transcriptional regulator